MSVQLKAAYVKIKYANVLQENKLGQIQFWWWC